MNGFKDKLRQIRQLDHRHWICIGLTLGSVAFGLLFINSIPRAIEALRDLGTSLVYYFCDLLFDESPLPATVTALPSWEWVPTRWEPLQIFPWTWEEFQVLCSMFWEALWTAENWEAYWEAFGEMMYYVSKFMLMAMPLFLCLFIYLGRYKNTYNNDHNEDSSHLRRAKRMLFRVADPTCRWVRDFVAFVKEHEGYWKTWLALWLIWFNVITIIIAFIAWYLYFIVSFDWASIYVQVLKLLIDLAPMVRFLPTLVWVTVAVWVFNYLCKKIAYDRLYHHERENRGFINERGVVTIIYGNMGVGKTALVTSMGLSAEVELRDMAFEILLETDIMFPNFPWTNLREEMKKRIEAHELVDVPSVKRWISGCAEVFEAALEDPIWWKRQMRKRRGRYQSFDYDFEHFSTTYNDNLKITKLYSAIEDYACAYFIYTVQTSLLISNYSVRTDHIMEDLGNFPLWDCDFFRRDARLMDAYSRHAHIIDFDMLRLGKRMLEENPNRNAFGFGVYLISEIDKERKNALELQETKIKDDACNQRNDLFNACLKMSRHACVIANKVFLKIICDLQRPEDWGAGGREVGEVVFIADKSGKAPTLPFFSPYWLCEGLFYWLKGHWDNFYVRYIANRADNTLLVQTVKCVISKIDNHYRKVKGTFDCETLHLEVESGRMQGDAKERKYYRMAKKDFSKRYSTNCLSAIFEGDEPNTVSINDFVSYAGIMATEAELQLQNSHFQTDLAKRKQKSLPAPEENEQQPSSIELVDATLLEAYSLLFVTSTANKKASSEDEE